MGGEGGWRGAGTQAGLGRQGWEQREGREGQPPETEGIQSEERHLKKHQPKLS